MERGEGEKMSRRFFVLREAVLRETDITSIHTLSAVECVDREHGLTKQAGERRD